MALDVFRKRLIAETTQEERKGVVLVRTKNGIVVLPKVSYLRMVVAKRPPELLHEDETAKEALEWGEQHGYSRR